MVEKDASHLWWAQVKGLSAQSRFGIAHSLFLFRKVIPKEKPLVSKYVEKLSTPSVEPDPDFKAFALRETRRLFPMGWDRTYQDACLTSSLPLTACSEGGRRDGGSRALKELEWRSRAEFCEYVMKASLKRDRGVSRVKAIETGGKWRIISIPPLVDNALRPLHKAIYSHLSRYDWLLRGDAKASRFKDFSPVEGEVFVSGDYESATDNLNSSLQLAIMSELLKRSGTIPTGIIEHALSSYESLLAHEEGQVFVQRRGQLMGQLTSFPLLCLINYITFRYSIRRPVPVRINGDDIVFRATPSEHAIWECNVAKGGLTLSKGKTFVHSRAFTLNSTPFWSQGSGARLVGFVRASALYPKGSLAEQIVSLSGRFYSACSGYGGMKRRVVREAFLRHNQKAVHASRRSVTRGLGMAVGEETLKSVGLWYRELFYLEQVEERPIPSECQLDGSLPPGWAMVGSAWFSKEDRERWKRDWISACVDHAWSMQVNFSPATVDSTLDKIRYGCSPYGLGSLISRRVRNMLRMTRSQVWRWVNLRRNSAVFGRVGRVRGQRMWVEVDLLAKRTQVDFVKAAMM